MLFRLYAPGKFGLIGGRIPFHIGDFIQRTKGIVRIPVAVQTPGHAERLHLLDDVHLRYIAMATETPHTGIQVSSVIEIHKIRQLVHFHPLDRGLGRIALANRQQLLAFRKDNLMAIHASLRRGNIRLRGALD